MPRTTAPLARATRVCALFLLGAAALALCEPGAVRGQPTTPKQTQPKPGEAPDLRKRWEVETVFAPTNPLLLIDLDGQVVVLTGRNKIEAVSFNVRTGKAGHELPTQVDATSNYRQLRLDKGVFLFQQGRSLVKELVTWDATTGKVGRTTFPTVTPTGLQTLNSSPNGRYMAVSTTRRAKGGEVLETPFRVFDSKTGKTAVSLEWLNGTALFTADSSRVLAVDATEHFRWFKLPSGQPDGEWKFDRPPEERFTRLLTISDDGGVILYAGTPPKGEAGVHLLNGKTGEVLHTFRGYSSEVGFLSPDGGSVMLVRTDVGGPRAEVLDARGTLLGKLTLPRRGQSLLPPPVAASWEARALAVHDVDASKVAVYDLPGAAGFVMPRPSRVGDAAVRNRAPVPGDAAVAKAEAGVQQVLKDEYARKQPVERRALAQKLIALAAETPDDPAARYVMLRDAQDLAVGIGDPALALQAIEGLAKWYQVEGAALQQTVLEKILASSTGLPRLKAVAELAGPAAEAAAAADEFDDAVEFAQLAYNAVRKGKLGQLAADEAESRLTQLKNARDDFATVRPAAERLKANPDDPAANSTIGKYRCFVQHRWDDGLKHLTRGQDAGLKAVAELDLAAPRTGTPEDTKAADAWHDYAQNASPSEQWAAQLRARYWYARTIPGLTGLNKARAESRLGFTTGGNEYRPGLVSELTAKQPTVLKGTKARIEPVVDFSGGEFSTSGKQTDLSVKWIGVLAPPRAGRYTITAETTDPVRVRVDNKVVIDTISAKGSRREAQVTLGDRPSPIVIEFTAPNTDKHKLKLTWTLPGRPESQPVGPEYLFHDKRTESLLGKQ
jgi:hypothetical protein